MREDLRKVNDKSSLEVLDNLVEKLEHDDEARSILDRMLNDAEGPRQFLEELYYKGVTEGVGMKRSDGTKSTVNVLKVAENIIEMRCAITKEASKLLSSQNLNHRYYYKMIKDFGGFQKFDLSRKPKFQLIDLDRRHEPNGGVVDEGGETGGYEATPGGFRSSPRNEEKKPGVGYTAATTAAALNGVKQPVVSADPSSPVPMETTEAVPAVSSPVVEQEQKQEPEPEEEYIDFDKPFGSDGPMMM